MSTVRLKEGGVTIGDIVEIARGDAVVETAPEVFDRLGKARAILEAAAAAGQPIYGMNTGLGANLKTPVESEHAAFQRQLVRGRGVAVGPVLPRDVTRAVIAARLAMLSVGGSGISPETYGALAAMLNAHVHPQMPSTGSIGAGDLVMLSAMARCLIGEGRAEFERQILDAGDALKRAGLEPARLKPKDGISLINASAVSVGEGALTLHDARDLLVAQRQAAALSFEALGGNPLILTPAIQSARPVPQQGNEAAAILDQLKESSLFESTVAIQDPLSLRCVAPIHAALADSLQRTIAIVEIELNSAADNPLVILNEERVLSTGNFHTPALALAFETLSLAIAQSAAASAGRFIQLTGAGRNGLPRYLSPVGGASAGFVPMQKVVTGLMAQIRHKANPVMLDFVPVSEGVEDHATQSALTVRKCAEMLDLWRQLIACEMLAAAQGVDLRPGHRCGHGTAKTHALIRKLVPVLDEDRALGEDAMVIFDALPFEIDNDL
jgi:histidine ammonia-lyase